MRVLIVCSFFLFITHSIKAQSNEIQDTMGIKKSINQLFQAMQQVDTIALKNCFNKNAVLQTIVTKENKTVVKDESLQAFIQSIGKQEKGSLEERIVYKSILIDKVLATVWTPYEFYFNGNYSHKGVNSFQLVKIDSNWKIQYLIDTRFKN